MAEHESTKVVLERAWSDIEPKVAAWFAAGGLLTVATIVYGYVYPSEPLPVWVAPVVTFVGGFVVSYLKKSSVTTVSPVESKAAIAQVTPTDDEPVTFDPPQA